MNSVNVSVEVPLENTVHEITYDGQEILQTPLSMSENLTRLAHRIDFSGKEDGGRTGQGGDSIGNGTGTDLEGGKNGEAEDASECTFKTTPAWPWESFRNKIRSALTELSVLSDILLLTQQKKYLVLDPVHAEQQEAKPAAALIYKKRGLGEAAKVLIGGADRIKTSLNEAKARSSLSSIPDFHIELLKLRQNWRLRKVGNSILGDLSYRTAGSRFPQAGLFEVMKAEDEGDGSEGTGGDGSPHPLPKPTSALRVVVPNELQGIAYIQVLIQKDEDVLSLANIGLLNQTSSANPVDGHWQKRLEAAQNVLFCRELFSVLAREAVQLNSIPIPPLVVGNQITATLFPETLLIIGLCHGTPSIGKGSGSGSLGSAPVTPKLDHNHVLEHSLHQLLREVHRQNSCIPLPHPATAPIGITRKRRLAGPLAYERHTLLQMSKKEGILEEMIRQAQHVVLRLKTMEVLDNLAKELKDPLLVAHWASLNAVTHSCVRVNFLSSGYDNTARTPLLIHVKEKSLKCILKDGRAIHLSHETQELRDVILSQIAIHQVMALQVLAKCMGWAILSSSGHLGVGKCEDLGNAAGCTLSAPNGRRCLAVRSTPTMSEDGIQVFLGLSRDCDSNGGDQTLEDLLNIGRNFKSLEQSFQGTTYKPIRLDKLEGKNFLNKMEMLMAVLSDAQ